MSLNVELLGWNDFEAKLNRLTPNIALALYNQMTDATIMLQGYIKEDKLTGQVLNVRSNNLRGSITAEVEKRDESVVGRVGTDVGYGAVHEFGGTFTIPAHTRRMAFNKRGEVVRRKLKAAVSETVVNVHSHQATFPERSFLRSAYRDKRQQLVEMFRQGIAEGVKQ